MLFGLAYKPYVAVNTAAAVPSAAVSLDLGIYCDKVILIKINVFGYINGK